MNDSVVRSKKRDFANVSGGVCFRQSQETFKMRLVKKALTFNETKPNVENYSSSLLGGDVLKVIL